MKKSKRARKRILIGICAVLLLCMSALTIFYMYIRNTIYSEIEEIEPIAQEELNSDIPIPTPQVENMEDKAVEPIYIEQTGITNILLVGTDSRNLNENSRADSIVIATIDANKRKLKFTSIMRDAYVVIKGHSPQKINAAFAYGGAALLMDTIERNFNLKLDKYVIINFWGFEDMIDALGGIEVNIKDYEINEMNKYIGEFRDRKSPPVICSGIQKLDGQQALAYSRIRRVGNGSYERNLRQREVLSILAQKHRDISMLQYPRLLSKLLPCIKTNIEPINLLNYSYTVSKFKPLEIGQLQMPLTELSDGRIYKGSWVLLMDKEQNAKVLSDFIFKDRVTKPEELDMKAFRRKIKEYLTR